MPFIPPSRSRESGKITPKMWILAALFAVAAAVPAYQKFYLGPQAEVREVVRGDLTQSIVATGRVMTPRRVQVGAVGTDRVVSIPVRDGQKVKRGQLLIELESRDEGAALAQTRAALAQSEARLRQMREVALPAAEQTLNQALANATQARLQFERSKMLREKGFIGEAQLDDARRAAEVSESQVRGARLQVETLKTGGSDHAIAVTAIEQARANLRASESRLEQTQIRAPVDGTLIARNVEPGNVVQPGRDLMVLAPEGETQIVALIDERHLARLALGQAALASADAYVGKRFAAELVYINPAVDAARGTVEIRLKVPGAPEYLRQDMTVSVDIEVAKRSSTLVAPADTVRDANGPSPWVLAIREGRATRVPVKLGIRGDTRIEITDGVAAGEWLIQGLQSAIEPGQRVRAVRSTDKPVP